VQRLQGRGDKKAKAASNNSRRMMGETVLLILRARCFEVPTNHRTFSFGRRLIARLDADKAKVPSGLGVSDSDARAWVPRWAGSLFGPDN
jgi:hypothetical protein